VLSQHRDQIVIQISHLFSNYIASLWSQLIHSQCLSCTCYLCNIKVISVLGQVSFLIPSMSFMYCRVLFSPSLTLHSLVWHSNFVVILSSLCVLWSSVSPEVRLSSHITFTSIVRGSQSLVTTVFYSQCLSCICYFCNVKVIPVLGQVGFLIPSCHACILQSSFLPGELQSLRFVTKIVYIVIL
jgi:hypothetical protein